jgi:hypothetical protein
MGFGSVNERERERNVWDFLLSFLLMRKRMEKGKLKSSLQFL